MSLDNSERANFRKIIMPLQSLQKDWGKPETETDRRRKREGKRGEEERKRMGGGGGGGVKG